METLRHVRACALAATMVASCAGLAWGGIIIGEFPAEPTVTEFPDGEPQDPPIADGEEADHGADVSLATEEPTYGGTSTAVTITALNVTVSATSEIRIPHSHNATSDDLYKHEYVHHRLARFEYARRAQEKMAAAARTLNGKTYASRDAANAAATAAAHTAYDTIVDQMQTLSDSYDDVTDHGRKDTPTASQAYDQLTGAREQAPNAGNGRAAVDTNRAWAGAGDPPAVEFVDGDVHFTGDMNIDQTADPMDPLRNLGVFSIGNMIPIGLNENGTVMLSDASFTIGATGGGTLVRGTLFEASYGASEVPGFAGMIQASLWIAPAMWGGVDNSIASPMLGEMAAASNAGTLMTFWFLSDQPLFNAYAEPAAMSAVTGKIRIGYTVPSPGSMAMLAIGLTTCMWGLRRR